MIQFAKYLMIASLVGSLTACGSDGADRGGNTEGTKERHERKPGSLSKSELSQALLLKEGDLLSTGEVLLEKSSLEEGLLLMITDERKILLDDTGSFFELGNAEEFSWVASSKGWIVFVDGKEYLLN